MSQSKNNKIMKWVKYHFQVKEETMDNLNLKHLIEMNVKNAKLFNPIEQNIVQNVRNVFLNMIIIVSGLEDV